MNKMSVVRVMTIDDYEKVYALWMSCKNMGFNNLDDSREGIAKYLRRNPATCFVAEQGEKIVGVILSGHDGRRGLIHHLAVAEDCRRQGIAAELLRHAEDSLKAEGINKIALFVFNRNEAGNAFWEKQGYTRREDLAYRNKALVEMVRIDT
jgi:ribosomal protein S18 acetylase RimI-like enzyme